MATACDPLTQEVHSLYRHHHGWLLAWLCRRLGCSHQAADLAHDTYLRVLLSGRAPAPEHARPHLVLIAKGLVVDRHRRARIERTYLDELARQGEALAPSPEERAIAIDTLMRIDALLDGLPPVVRETFLLSQLAGLTYSEIGAKLSISTVTVRKHMQLALGRCLRALDDEALLPLPAARGPTPDAGPR